jgi:hypothetical protein
MSEQPAPAARQPLEPPAADAVRSYAAAERAKTDTLASVLEDIATNGYPAPETGVLWETARDAHLATLADKQARVA